MSSKLLPVLAAGAGTATVSVGGFYLVKNSGTGDAVDTNKNPISKDVQTQTFIDQLSEFKRDNKGDDCVKEIFSSVEGLSDLNGATEIVKDKPKSSDFFGTQSADGDKSKSCLEIKWQKKSKNEGGTNKWSGTFTWSWSFVNDKKGFITFNVAKTVSNNELQLTGGAYLLEKGDSGDPSKWKVKHHKEIKDTDTKKISTSVTFDDWFPKNKDGSDTFKVNSKDYWDFIEDSSKLSEICDGGDCKAETETIPKDEKWSWKWVDKGSDKVTDWSKSLKWWENMYGKEVFDLETGLGSFQGTWSQKTK